MGFPCENQLILPAKTTPSHLITDNQSVVPDHTSNSDYKS